MVSDRLRVYGKGNLYIVCRVDVAKCTVTVGTVGFLHQMLYRLWMNVSAQYGTMYSVSSTYMHVFTYVFCLVLGFCVPCKLLLVSYRTKLCM